MLPNGFDDWFYSTDGYGNRLVQDWERPFVERRWEQVKDSLPPVLEGKIGVDHPNAIILFHKDKHITLAHYLRPCPCDECEHEWQIDCYFVDCECCSSECC